MTPTRSADRGAAATGQLAQRPAEMIFLVSHENVYALYSLGDTGGLHWAIGDRDVPLP
jgi:hypothetical protein